MELISPVDWKDLSLEAVYNGMQMWYQVQKLKFISLKL